MTSGTKFLDASDITRAIEEVRELARPDVVAVVLAGGAAMQIYGSDRLTKDVDFIAAEPIPGLPDEGPLSFGGYKSHTPSGVPVDVILRSDDYEGLYEEAIQTAEKDPELRVSVVSPEYLAAMKMAAGRVKDEEDLRSLILSGNLDLGKAETVIREWLGRYGLSSFRSFVEEAKWRAGRGQ